MEVSHEEVPITLKKYAKQVSDIDAFSTELLDAVEKVFKKYKGAKWTEFHVKNNKQFTLIGKL